MIRVTFPRRSRCSGTIRLNIGGEILRDNPDGSADPDNGEKTLPDYFVNHRETDPECFGDLFRGEEGDRHPALPGEVVERIQTRGIRITSRC